MTITARGRTRAKPSKSKRTTNFQITISCFSAQSVDDLHVYVVLGEGVRTYVCTYVVVLVCVCVSVGHDENQARGRTDGRTDAMSHLRKDRDLLSSSFSSDAPSCMEKVPFFLLLLLLLLLLRPDQTYPLSRWYISDILYISNIITCLIRTS